MCALFCAALHAKDPEMQKRLKDNGNQDKERKRERERDQKRIGHLNFFTSRALFLISTFRLLGDRVTIR